MERIGSLAGKVIPKGEDLPTPSLTKTIEQQARNKEDFDRPRRIPFRPRSDLTSIDGILANVLARTGLERKVQQYKFIRHWEMIVGKHLASISQPEAIYNRILVIQVSSSVWAQEMAFLKSEILIKLKPYFICYSSLN